MTGPGAAAASAAPSPAVSVSTVVVRAPRGHGRGLPYAVRVEPDDDAPRTAAPHSPVTTGFLLATGVLMALAVAWVLRANADLIVWIAAALFIALGLDPVVRGVEHLGRPRWVGVTAVALGVLAVAGAVAGLLVPTVVQQSAQLVGGLPDTVGELMATGWFQVLDRELGIRQAVQSWLDGLSTGGGLAEDFGGIVGIGQTVLHTAFAVLVVAVLSLYFLAALPQITHWVYRLAPRSRRARVRALGDEITSSVGLYVMGQTAVAVLNGTVAFVAMGIAGTPVPVLMAFVAAVFAFIPLVGAVIGGLVLTAVSLLAGWETAAVFAAIYFVYLQVEAYVVSPRIMARAVAVPASVAVIAVIAGGTLLGVLGALMAIPTAAAVLLLVREVLAPRQDAR